MAASQQMLIAVGAASPSLPYWNPSDKDASIFLTAGNASASKSSGFAWTSVRSVTEHTAGKRYAECLSAVNTDTYMVFGVCTSAHTLASFIGSAATGWSIHANKLNPVDTYTNSVATAAGSLSIGAGGYARIAVDLDAGNLWLGTSASATWAGGGDPAAGTSATYTFTPGTQLFLGLSIFGAGQTCTLRNNVGENGGTIPTGFSMWG